MTSLKLTPCINSMVMKDVHHNQPIGWHKEAVLAQFTLWLVVFTPPDPESWGPLTDLSWDELDHVA